MLDAPQPARHPRASLEGSCGSTQGMAVTTHHLATETAVAVMRRGGNGVDAAVAANAVLSVVRPDTCGPGGDLFALVHVPGEAHPAALNASGRAGSNASGAALREAGHTTVPLRGGAGVTVPGCVYGWAALLDRYGTLPMAELLAPAITAAVDGFSVSSELADSLLRIRPLIGGEASAAALYPDGEAPRAGTRIRRPDLGSTLEALAEGGPEAFYGGEVAAGIVAATDGAVTTEDLARNQADWVEPLGMEVFGIDVWTVPPNSQGHLVLTSAWLAERIGIGTDSTDAGYHHALIEAYRAVAWERDLLTTDPTTAPLDAAAIVDPARLDARISRIRPDRVASWPSSRDVPGGTMYLCVRDGSGLGVSLIQSNFHGIGSGLGAGSTGVFLHNRGAGFTLEPGHRNELAPGRRPLHTLAPTTWTEAGRLRLLLGTRGGQYQPQVLLQAAAHRFAAGLPLGDAVAAPRWIADHWGPDETHEITVEARMDPGIVAGLRRRGHSVSIAGGWQSGWGPVAAIEVDDVVVRGSGDPRVTTSGTGVT